MPNKNNCESRYLSATEKPTGYLSAIEQPIRHYRLLTGRLVRPRWQRTVDGPPARPVGPIRAYRLLSGQQALVGPIGVLIGYWRADRGIGFTPRPSYRSVFTVASNLLFSPPQIVTPPPHALGPVAPPHATCSPPLAAGRRRVLRRRPRGAARVVVAAWRRRRLPVPSFHGRAASIPGVIEVISPLLVFF